MTHRDRSVATSPPPPPAAFSPVGLSRQASTFPPRDPRKLPDRSSTYGVDRSSGQARAQSTKVVDRCVLSLQR
eukprot:341903-Prorocentrum_minimum.AAC.1